MSAQPSSTSKSYQKFMEKTPELAYLFSGSRVDKRNGEEVLRLPFDDPVAFSLLVSWLVLGRFQPINMIFHTPYNGSIFDHLRLYFFAEKYYLVELMDYTMSFIMATYQHQHLLPSKYAMKFTYNCSPLAFMMREFMSRAVLYALSTIVKGIPKFLQVLDNLNWYPEVLEDVTELYHYFEGTGRHPMAQHWCNYHVHTEKYEDGSPFFCHYQSKSMVVTLSPEV